MKTCARYEQSKAFSSSGRAFEKGLNNAFYTPLPSPPPRQTHTPDDTLPENNGLLLWYLLMLSSQMQNCAKI